MLFGIELIDRLVKDTEACSTYQLCLGFRERNGGRIKHFALEILVKVGILLRNIGNKSQRGLHVQRRE